MPSSVPVRYVGHPSVDKVLLHSKAEDRAQFGWMKINRWSGCCRGSRANENPSGCWPVMLAAAKVASRFARHPVSIAASRFH